MGMCVEPDAQYVLESCQCGCALGTFMVKHAEGVTGCNTVELWLCMRMWRPCMVLGTWDTSAVSFGKGPSQSLLRLVTHLNHVAAARLAHSRGARRGSIRCHSRVGRTVKVISWLGFCRRSI